MYVQEAVFLYSLHEKSTKHPYLNQRNCNQSLNRMFRAGLHLDAGSYASNGLNPTLQSPIGSECVCVKGESNTGSMYSSLEY